MSVFEGLGTGIAVGLGVYIGKTIQEKRKEKAAAQQWQQTHQAPMYYVPSNLLTQPITLMPSNGLSTDLKFSGDKRSAGQLLKDVFHKTNKD